MILEKVYDELMAQIEDLKKAVAGGTGSKDYDKLDNRPKVNNITLTGNKKSSDLKIAYSMTESEYAAATKNAESIYCLQENATTFEEEDETASTYIHWTEASSGYAASWVYTPSNQDFTGCTDVECDDAAITIDQFQVVEGNVQVFLSCEDTTQIGSTVTFTFTLTQPAGATRIVKNGVQFGGVAGSVKYSETEHVIGTWLNNKPVYEITLNLTTSSGDSEAAITLNDYGVQNIDDVVGIEALSTSGGTGGIAPNYYAGSGDRFNIFMTSKTTLTISHYGSWTHSQKLYVTLRYTKTND